MNATYEIHIERLKAIDRASRAVNKAAEMCFNMFLDHDVKTGLFSGTSVILKGVRLIEV